jgi:hypothetical protein
MNGRIRNINTLLRLLTLLSAAPLAAATPALNELFLKR